MGKRKYDDDSKGVSKKSKNDNNSEEPAITDTEEGQPQYADDNKSEKLKPNKPRLFDIKHFRKELQGKQGQTMGQFLIKVVYV